MRRRAVLSAMGAGLAWPLLGPAPLSAAGTRGQAAGAPLTLFLCGDVMTGRGIDQVLPHPGDPHLHEPYVTDANSYVELAEARNGPIPRSVAWDYIWGEALAELSRVAPDARIINLETSITTSDDAWPGKIVRYRMHPRNVPCLSAARIDCCALANNHVLDFGRPGLHETLATLQEAGIAVAGAGRDLAAAAAPAILEVPGRAGQGRVLVFGLGATTSGIPAAWAATGDVGGVALLPDVSARAAEAVGRRVNEIRGPGDLVVASVHWGGNWGYEVPAGQRYLAHALIDHGVDVVHGHSSHHVKGIEVHRGRPIFYGCGDLITDYEGIRGQEAYRGDLSLLYFVTFDTGRGALQSLEMVPCRIVRFRLRRANRLEAKWLRDTLTSAGREFGTAAVLAQDDTLRLHWS